MRKKFLKAISLVAASAMVVGMTADVRVSANPAGDSTDALTTEETSAEPVEDVTEEATSEDNTEVTTEEETEVTTEAPEGGEPTPATGDYSAILIIVSLASLAMVLILSGKKAHN